MQPRTTQRATAFALAALVTATVLGGIGQIAATQHASAMAANASVPTTLAANCGCQRKG